MLLLQLTARHAYLNKHDRCGTCAMSNKVPAENGNGLCRAVAKEEALDLGTRLGNSEKGLYLGPYHWTAKNKSHLVVL